MLQKRIAKLRERRDQEVLYFTEVIVSFKKRLDINTRRKPQFIVREIFIEKQGSMEAIIGYGVLTVIGIIGVVLTCSQFFHLLRKKHLTTFNRTLLSLCIADLSSCISLSANGIVRINNSTSGISFSKMAMNILIASSILHMIFIAVQRLVAVRFPLQVNLILNRTRSAAILLSIWTLAFAYGYVVARVFTKDAPTANSVSVFATAFVLSSLYVAIGHKISKENRIRLQKTQSKHNVKNRLVLFHSLLITVAFLVAYIPFAVYKLFLVSTSLPFFIFTILLTCSPIFNSFVYFKMQHVGRTKLRKVAYNGAMFSSEMGNSASL